MTNLSYIYISQTVNIRQELTHSIYSPFFEGWLRKGYFIGLTHFEPSCFNISLFIYMLNCMVGTYTSYEHKTIVHGRHILINMT